MILKKSNLKSLNAASFEHLPPHETLSNDRVNVKIKSQFSSELIVCKLGGPDFQLSISNHSPVILTSVSNQYLKNNVKICEKS